MNDTERMAKEIDCIAVALTGLLMIASLVLFPKAVKAVTLGIGIGSLTGFIGFHMILRMSKNIVEGALNGQGNAYLAYLHRSLLYAAIFGFSIYRGVNVIALLTGMLAHKASILIYTWRHRKEDD